MTSELTWAGDPRLSRIPLTRSMVPFALWNKTAFLAERVLGSVVSAGVKVLVLAVIVGIGGGLFAQFGVAAGTDPRWTMPLR